MSDLLQAQGPSKIPPPLPPRPGVRRPQLPNRESASSVPAPLTANSGAAQPTQSPEVILSDENSPDAETSSVITASTHDQVEEDLPEAKLRELYENEEIERFFQHFSAHVKEESILSDDDDDTLYVPGASSTSVNTIASRSAPVSYNSLSESMAYNFLVPLLPPPPPASPSFTFIRLKLALQRLYLIFETGYLPFFLRMKSLATWKDRNRSSAYCAAYWILWFHDLLLPAFFAYVLYILLRRRVLPYPTLAELREHRREIIHAREFGDEMHIRMFTSQSFELKDAWGLWKKFRKPKKATAKLVAEEKTGIGKGPSGKLDAGEQGGDETTTVPMTNAELEKDVKTSPSVDQENTDLSEKKKAALRAMNELADLQERMKNIFLWRRPSSSWMYVALTVFLFLATLLVPARYLAKTIYFSLGCFFWHVIPVIVAMTPADRSRFPPPLKDAPTDAEFAMDLISRRVAQGLPVLPPANDIAIGSLNPDQSEHGSHADQGSGQKSHGSKGGSKNVNWKKWGERAAQGKAWANDAKRLVKKNASNDPSIVPSSSLETHTFPATHSKGPGLITVTSTTLYFTPMVSSRPTVTIPAKDITGIKKTGLMKGLAISWSSTNSNGILDEMVEKFRWVGGRDEVFARLLGPGGRRWIKV
ncbi:hypothetical protein EW146_g22 [Bondarzewia mesenterica]|uniref:Uncharacterized protein n=1 Tax=Bondarzewia mesenterica TaxID=1095465 RepID=A0A4S4M863_9AGAM|nr:hypothetical protein EW146_g22 [Bondarzewia mesenterica]